MQGWRLLIGIWLAVSVITVTPQVDDDYRIIFSSDRDTGDNWQLYSMNPDGSDVQRLTDSTTNHYNGVLSPDGTQLAYTQRTPSGYTEIYIATPDNALPERMLTPGANPTWSPDSTQLAYTQSANGNTDIYIIDATGLNNRQLTANPAADYAPSWSPDGQWIAFKSNREPDAPMGLYIVRPNRTDLRRLTDTDTAHHPPSWSPDSSQLAYTREINDVPSVHTVSAETGASRRVSGSLTPDFSPAFVPAGNALIFVSVEDNQPDIHRMDLIGESRTRLTDHPGWDWLPMVAR